MRAVQILASVATLAGIQLLAGCGESCQTTCTHVYAENECGIVLAGVTPNRLIDDCVTECERALQTPGDMGDYNPDVHVPASTQVHLETDQQAAAWIDCVWRVAPEEGHQESCAQLDPRNGGVCAPI